MIPIVPNVPKRKPLAYKADLSVATPSPDSATGAMAFSVSFNYSELASPPSSSPSSSCSSCSMPPPPPPTTPNDDMLDITPRKCSFSTFSSSTPRTNSICAFPSWPNRPSLLNNHDCARESTASSYLSDEDLLPDSPDSPDSDSGAATAAIDEESAARKTPTASYLTTEQQIQLVKAAIEEERCRARFLAQVRAHQAVRMTQEMMHPMAGKRRSRSDKRRPRLGSNLYRAS